MARDISKVKDTKELMGKPETKKAKTPKFKEIAEKLDGEMKTLEEVTEEKSRIIYVPLDRIHPHMDNPRKDLGDLAELAESIRKNGIMQNLTLVPDEVEEGEYYCLIGHRRCEAARKAGLSEVPAVIKTGLSANEQLGIMLEENIQRTDLTIIEQAQGFQMMLDLGDTVADIVKKTGFSESTVRHRVKLNEVNPDLLEEKQYQFTLADLYELEKVDDPEKKNEILEKSQNAEDLKRWILNYMREKEREEKVQTICAYLEEHGVQEYTGDDWYGKGDVILSLEIGQKEEELIKKLKEQKFTENLFYKKPDRWDYAVHVRDLSEKEKEESDDPGEAVTEEVVFKQKNRERKEALTARIKEMQKWRENFLKDLLVPDAGKNPFEKSMSTEGQLTLINEILEKQLENYAGLDANDLLDFAIESMQEKGLIGEKEEYEDEDVFEQEVKDHLKEVPACVKLVTMFFINMNNYKSSFYSEWQDSYNPERAGTVMALYRLIERLGLPISGEEKEILGGTHELYKEIVPEEEV